MSVVGVEENQVTDSARLAQGVVNGDRPGGVMPNERYPIEPERVEDSTQLTCVLGRRGGIQFGPPKISVWAHSALWP